MFAAVLHRTEGTHSLLPYLAEPLQYAVAALSGADAARVSRVSVTGDAWLTRTADSAQSPVSCKQCQDIPGGPC